MSLLSPGPNPSISGRVHRTFSLLAHHRAKLEIAYEWTDRLAIALTVLLAVSLAAHWKLPEWLPSSKESIEIAVAVFISLYMLYRLLLKIAKSVDRRNPFGTAEEGSLDWREPCSQDVVVVASPVKSQDEYARDLVTAVKLCQESLGFEHDEFSVDDRRALYNCWCRANEKSIVLIKPNWGAAQNQAIGVTIILPLAPEGLSYIQDRRGGVLKLDERYILPSTRRSAPTLLIDTVLLKDEWIPAYGPLAMKVLFHHLSMFYNPRSWMTTEFYCCIHQGGKVGTYLGGMRKLIGSRKFSEFGKTAEGETIFRLCIRAFAADPINQSRHQLYRSIVETCWKNQRHAAPLQ